MKLTFQRRAAALAFASMAEGMWENYRDDAVMGDTAAIAQRDLWDAFMDAVNAATHPDDVLAYEIDDRYAALAKDVVDNCDDNAHDMGLDTPADIAANPDDAALACCGFEVTIRRNPQVYLKTEITTREALEHALALLTKDAEETDTASPEGHLTRVAMMHVEMMLAQRGLEVFHNGDDGTLCDFCDVVIYG